MRINLNNVNLDFFNIKEGILGGEICYLITPKELSAPWNQENKIFRSSIWDKNGNPVSLSFPKFVNFGEKPEIFPVPDSLVNTNIVTKVDGSALIVSRFKGQTIHRTRGTFDVAGLENGHEINFLKEKYPKVFDFGGKDTHNETWIYEWTTPTQKICLDYGPEPQLHLIGIINHEDYRLIPQIALDVIASQLGVGRPERHTFKDLPDMLQTVQNWNGLEGVCLYSKNDQEIHKIKSFSYLTLHHFKSNATLENTVELFFEFGCPNFQEFQAKLIEKFDWECANLVLGFCSQICDSYKEVLKIIEGFKDFLMDKTSLTRKEIAAKILDSYGQTNRASFVFNILDRGELDNRAKLKLMWQMLKK